MATCLCFVVLHCWLCKAKIVISLQYIISPMSGVVGGGRDFSGIYFVSSQAVASGPRLLFCTFKQTLVISASGKADMDLRKKPAWHWTPREWAPVALNTSSSLFFSLPPASAPFHPLSIPELWQKVCILGETPGDVMDMRALFEMETHTFYAAREHREYPSRDGDGKWNKWKKK